MAITDLSTFTSKQGVTTAVWRYDEADTYVVQHDFMHLSFFQDDFKEFVDTLIVALRAIEKTESPIRHIHPVAVREADLSDEALQDLKMCKDGETPAEAHRTAAPGTVVSVEPGSAHIPEFIEIG